MNTGRNELRNLNSSGVQISSDFGCGAGNKMTQLGPDHYALVIPFDPESIEAAKGYDYYFCVRLSNVSCDSRAVTLDAMRPGYTNRKTRWHLSSLPVFVSEDLGTWYVLDQVEASENHEEYRVTVPLKPGQTLYLCNSLPYPSGRMSAWLKGMQGNHPDRARLSSIGRSAHGREILLFSITDPTVDDSVKDRVLVTSGFHPAEPDWLATTAIIELLLSDERWSRDVLQGFILDVIVQVNPDGTELGTNGCNAQGINMYWDFRSHQPQTSPEATHLWNWIGAHPPHIYIDFHCYVYQLQKDFRPYIRPLSDYVRSARPVAHAIDRRLIELCNGRFVQGPITNIPTTLAAQITDAFGTITYTKFHLHLNHGVVACRQLGVEVFKIVAETANAYRPLAPRVIPDAGRWRSPADYWLYWWEQSQTASRMRSLWRRINHGLGMSNPSANDLLPVMPENGLATHWRQHLWSQRGRVAPVIAIGSKVGTL